MTLHQEENFQIGTGTHHSEVELLNKDFKIAFKICYRIEGTYKIFWASLVAQTAKNLPTMQEDPAQPSG